MFGVDGLCSLRWNEASERVEVIDQTVLPHQLRWIALNTLDDYCHAIAAMQVRGAPLIGITAGFGLAHAIAQDGSDAALELAHQRLLSTRPTAVNLRWALQQVSSAVRPLDPALRPDAAGQPAPRRRAAARATCERIGNHGLPLLQGLARGETLNVMTHCNAGWLATVQWGTALAPIYKAHSAGIPVHVWVSETRPRNQGMHLTAWELQSAGVPFTVVADNGCGQLMQQGMVDCVMVGSDRTAANGDVCNKIGTYLKALAARASDIPLYVALPASTIDWQCARGDEIPIEERGAAEVLTVAGADIDGAMREVKLVADGVAAHNPAFDVTPAALVAALITEHGVFQATTDSLNTLKSQLDVL
ncbi:MAG: S-methyl-5-thioribose-1-phosphate isomerase [Halioglobus sp.]